jgi:hypothetical protein
VHRWSAHDWNTRIHSNRTSTCNESQGLCNSRGKILNWKSNIFHRQKTPWQLLSKHGTPLSSQYAQNRQHRARSRSIRFLAWEWAPYAFEKAWVQLKLYFMINHGLISIVVHCWSKVWTNLLSFLNGWAIDSYCCGFLLESATT